MRGLTFKEYAEKNKKGTMQERKGERKEMEFKSGILAAGWLGENNSGEQRSEDENDADGYGRAGEN